jgi:transcriptional regulator of acetoin/glycerol metabolism
VIAEKGSIRNEQLPPGIIRPWKPSAPLQVHGTNAKESEEKAQLIDALRQTGGNQTRAAKILGVNRVTVWNRMRKYGIDLKKVLVP